MRSDPRVRYAAASRGQSASTTAYARVRRGASRAAAPGWPPRRPSARARVRGHLPRVGLRVRQGFPHSPVHDGGGQPEGAPGVREGVEEGAGRGVVTEPARAEDARRSTRTARNGAPSFSTTESCSSRDGIQLRTEHGVHVVVGHVAQTSPGRRRRRPGRCPPARADSVPNRSNNAVIAASSVASAATSISVVPVAARRCGQLVAAAAGVAGDRDNRSRPHVGELPDQVRTDVSGRPDDQVAAVGAEYIGSSSASGCAARAAGHGGRPPRYTTWSSPSPACASASTYRAVSTAGTDLVEIDDPAPDFGMLQRQRAAQSPQHGMRRVGPITCGDGLGVAGER